LVFIYILLLIIKQDFRKHKQKLFAEALKNKSLNAKTFFKSLKKYFLSKKKYFYFSSILWGFS